MISEPLVWTAAGSLGHAIAAVLFASLAILTSRRAGSALDQQLLVMALALTALWSLRHALGSMAAGTPLSDGIAETMRNGAWLAAIWAYLRVLPSEGALRWARPLVVAALALLLLAQLGFDLLVGEGAPVNAGLLPYFRASWLLRCMFALGALVLLHGFSARRDHPEVARGEAWMAAALAFMWAYDFNHYILTWATDNAMAATGPMRGFVVALLSLPLMVALRTDGQRRFALSRQMVLRMVSGGILLVYLLSVLLLVSVAGNLAAPLGRVVQLSLLFALAVAVLALLPSAGLRSWLRVEITKHLFSHRYDYRAVWLGFAATVGKTGVPEGALGERLTRAIAEVMQARGALLYLRGGDGALAPTHDWQWPADAPALEPLDATLAARLEASGWILDIAADWASHGHMLPAWMEHSPLAWVLAPLVHDAELVGAVLLAAPDVPRRIDWEDLDVLRVLCGEAAALIGAARGRAALAEAQRFEEFNRRFAFILHDIKNLVSQMSLLASNAERHADNPAFRADMVLTLKETAARMTDLLQRLGRPGAAPRDAGATLDPGALVRTLHPRWTSRLGPVELEGTIVGAVIGDADTLERALGHLVKNALEASPADVPVRVELHEAAGRALIHVIDRGCGMSEDFIRDELFRPFASTKANGFGLGVHETRLLVQAMGGTLGVTSRPGEGTRFTISLPLVETNRQGSPGDDGARPTPETLPDTQRRSA
jgi:putative PEP-CTERM system histidine kinase